MTKRTSPRRSNCPPIPVVTSATWQALVAAAAAFGTLAPWTWMHDSELVGLRDPATGDKLLCSILGRLRTVFALLVFRRVTGHRWILNTIMEDDDSDEPKDPDSGLEQDCVKVAFTSKSELTTTDRDVLTAGGFSPSVKRGCVWPAFRSLVPGGFPWYLTQAEAEILVYALPRVGAFAALCRDNPEMGANFVIGEVPFLKVDFDPSSRSLRPEDLDWQPHIPPPEAPPTPVSLDEATLERLLKLPQAKGFHLELDVFYSPMAVSEGDRAWFPKAVMAVDRASGFIGGYQLAKSSDPEAVAVLAEVLAGSMQQLVHRPETIRIQRRRLVQILSSVAVRLGISVCQDPELPALNLAREEIAQMFHR